MPLIIDYKDIDKLKRKRTVRRVGKIKAAATAEKEFRQKIGFVWKESVFPAMEELKQRVKDGQDILQIADFLERALEDSERLWGNQAESIIDMWKLAVDRETRAIISRALSKSLGIDISSFVDSPEIDEAIQVSTIASTNLIKTIPQEFFSDVAKAVTDNYRGVPLPEDRSLLDQIQHIGKVSKNRAKIIARDQTAKLTSDINRVRQQSIGVETYFWRTVKDQRVAGHPSQNKHKFSDAHKNHFIMEGKLCRWDDSTVYSTDNGKTWKKRTSDMPKNTPGQDIMCRCYSEPKIEINKILQFAKVA